MPLEIGLGGELVATLSADLPLSEVAGADVDLKVTAAAELSSTDLTGQVRPEPGVFAPLVSRQAPLAPAQVVTVGAGEDQIAVGALSVSLQVVLPPVGLLTNITGKHLPSVDQQVSLQADLLGGLIVTLVTRELPSLAFLLFLLLPLN